MEIDFFPLTLNLADVIIFFNFLAIYDSKNLRRSENIRENVMTCIFSKDCYANGRRSLWYLNGIAFRLRPFHLFSQPKEKQKKTIG